NRLGHGLGLVSMKRDRFAVNAEDASGVGVKCAAPHEIVDRFVGLESRVNADQRLRPETIAGIKAFHLFPDVLCPDFCKGSSEPLVIPYQSTIEIKHIHGSCSPSHHPLVDGTLYGLIGFCSFL